MIDPRIYEMFREIGEDLYAAQMISSHGGNLSIRQGGLQLLAQEHGVVVQEQHRPAQQEAKRFDRDALGQER